jgi:hypothetical protein
MDIYNQDSVNASVLGRQGLVPDPTPKLHTLLSVQAGRPAAKHLMGVRETRLLVLCHFSVPLAMSIFHAILTSPIEFVFALPSHIQSTTGSQSSHISRIHRNLSRGLNVLRSSLLLPLVEVYQISQRLEMYVS